MIEGTTAPIIHRLFSVCVEGLASVDEAVDSGLIIDWVEITAFSDGLALLVCSWNDDEVWGFVSKTSGEVVSEMVFLLWVVADVDVS